jgi:hypothetical protein
MAIASAQGWAGFAVKTLPFSSTVPGDGAAHAQSPTRPHTAATVLAARLAGNPGSRLSASSFRLSIL